MALTRDQILAKRNDLPREAVDVPSLGGSVYVRVLSMGQLLKLVDDEKAYRDAGRSRESQTLVIIAAACDETGAPLFTGDDAEAILGLPVDAIKTISDAAMRVNNIGDEAEAAVRKN